MELFETIRRDHRLEGLSIRALARRHGVHRRTVRLALPSAMPPERKAPEREAPALGPHRDWIREILEADRSAPRSSATRPGAFTAAWWRRGAPRVPLPLRPAGLGAGRPVEAVAGTEGRTVGPEEHHTHLRVPVGLVDGPAQLVAESRSDGVVLLRPAEDDGSDAGLGLGAEGGGHEATVNGKVRPPACFGPRPPPTPGPGIPSPSGTWPWWPPSWSPASAGRGPRPHLGFPRRPPRGPPPGRRGQGGKVPGHPRGPGLRGPPRHLPGLPQGALPPLLSTPPTPEPPSSSNQGRPSPGTRCST